MALMYTPEVDLNSEAPDFQRLSSATELSSQGHFVSLSDFSNKPALLVIFMCNHCPYVIAVQDRINALAREFMPKGLAVVGISSNDPAYREEDSFENMKIRARELDYVFPYLFDETQNIARAYGAVCTPDPFLFQNENGKFLLKYRGRIDDSWKDPAMVTRSDLRDAIQAVLDGKSVATNQMPSMGCSIKWKNRMS